MIIKEYSKLSRENIFNSLSKKSIFIDNNKLIKKLPGELYYFKRNLLSDSFIIKNKLDSLYNEKEFYSYNLKIGIKWLYIEDIINNSIKYAEGNKKKQYEHILTKNKLSTELYLNKPNLEFYRGRNNLSKKIIENIMLENNIILFEIPHNFILFKVITFIKDIDCFISSLNIVRIPPFKLRIKKIKKYGKDGMFIGSNLIVLDPRETKSFYHEFAHFIYEHKLNFTIKNKRYYFKSLPREITNFKSFELDNYKHLEKYSIDSERFAFWFENKFSN